MTDLLDQAVATARSLSPDMQDEIARQVLAYAGEVQPIYRVTPDEDAEQDKADAAEARGDCATEDELRAIWAK